MKASFQRIRNTYVRFVDKQGFPIIVTLCVAVITATALWTRRQEALPASPTPPSANVPAAQLIQQALRDVATPSPSPSVTPRRWSAPLEEISVLTPFSRETMVECSIPGVWTVHAAVDLGCQRGEPIRAMADGTVISAGQDKLRGAWLRIDHGDSVEVLYAGMAATADYITGDAVKAGGIIGYGGNSMAEETKIGPHLHVQAVQDGQTIDPLALLQP